MDQFERFEDGESNECNDGGGLSKKAAVWLEF